MNAVLERFSHLVNGSEHGAGNAESGAAKVEQGAERVRHTRGFRGFARLGMLSRAVVYLLLGTLILEVAANGRAPSPTDSQGAFNEVAHQPAGTETLALLAIGLAAYAIWRLVEALSQKPRREQVASGWTRAGWIAIGALYIGLCVNVVRTMMGSRPSGGPTQHPSSFAAEVFRLPLGPELLGFVAAAVAGAGLALIIWGVTHDYGRELRTTQMKPATEAAARWSGISGNAARGAAVMLVAISLFVSAISTNPSQAKSLDAALQQLARTPAGLPLLSVLGAGFLAFGVHSLIESRFRSV